MKHRALDRNGSDNAKRYPQEGTANRRTANTAKTSVRGIGTGAIAASMAAAFREEKLGIRVGASPAAGSRAPDAPASPRRTRSS